MASEQSPLVHLSHHRTYGSRIRRFVNHHITALYTSEGFSLLFG